MMYNNKLAIAIKSGGRVLREFGESVYVPFGTEYTLLIKNLHTTKVLVNVSIDGTNATDNGVIIEAGKELELERFLKKDLNKGNKFKFIERTSSIEKHKGVGIEDGLVVVNYQFEKPPIIGIVHYTSPIYISSPIVIDNDWMYNPTPATPWNNYPITCQVNNLGGGGTSTSLSYSSQQNEIKSHDSNQTLSTNTANANGITVPGAISEQKFVHGHIGSLEITKHSMIIKLLGETDDKKPVSRPVTVNIKPKCVTCGRKNKSHQKFCGACGTALEILA